MSKYTVLLLFWGHASVSERAPISEYIIQIYSGITSVRMLEYKCSGSLL